MPKHECRMNDDSSNRESSNRESSVGRRRADASRGYNAFVLRHWGIL